MILDRDTGGGWFHINLKCRVVCGGGWGGHILLNVMVTVLPFWLKPKRSAWYPCLIFLCAWIARGRGLAGDVEVLSARSWHRTEAALTRFTGPLPMVQGRGSVSTSKECT